MLDKLLTSLFRLLTLSYRRKPVSILDAAISWKTWIPAFAGMTLTFILIAPAQAEVTASLDRSAVPEGDSVILQIRVQGDNDAEPDISPLREQFHVVSQSQSSQLQFINGTRSTTKDWFIQLFPKTTGKITIPSLMVGNEQTQPIEVNILKQSNTNASGERSDLYLEVEAEKQQVYVQAQLLYHVRLFYAIELAEGASLTPPDSADFLVHKMGEDKVYEQVVKNKPYRVVERTYSLFPQKSGTLHIPSIQLQGNILDRNSPQSQNFGSLFPQFNTRTRPVQLQSESPTIEVLPKPSSFSGQWWLPAKSVTLEQEWSGDLAVWKAGEPLTRTIKIVAEGILDNQLPEIASKYPATLKTYPDQPNRATVDKTKGVLAVVDQKIALIPTQAGDMEIPAFELQWWDTDSNQMRVAKLPAQTLHILPGSANAPASAPPTAALIAPNLLGESNHSSEPSHSGESRNPSSALPPTTTPNQATTSWMHDLWFWMSLTLGTLWLGTLFLWRRTVQKMDSGFRRNDKLFTSSSDAEQQALLKKLERACAENNSQQIRAALLGWAQAQWPEQRPINFQWISQQLECPALASQMQSLDAMRYGTSPESEPAFNGQAFWPLFQDCRKTAEQRQSTGSNRPALAPLHA